MSQVLPVFPVGRASEGIELTMQEHWDENNIDPIAEIDDLIKLEAWASGRLQG